MNKLFLLTTILSIISFSVFADTIVTKSQIDSQNSIVSADRVVVAKQQAINTAALAPLQTAAANDQAILNVLQTELQQQNAAAIVAKNP